MWPLAFLVRGVDPDGVSTNPAQAGAASTKVDEDIGMTIFVVSDGADWLPEVPWLSMVEDEDTSQRLAQVNCEGDEEGSGREEVANKTASGYLEDDGVAL